MQRVKRGVCLAFVLLFLYASDIIIIGIKVIVPKGVVIMLLMITRTAPARYHGTL